MGARSRRPIVVLLCMLALVAASPAVAKDGDDEVRATRVCGGGAVAELRLKTDDGDIDLRFEVDHDRAGVPWRIVLVHERRVVWRVDARRTRANGSFEIRRTLRDLPGSDAISVRASDARGLVCRVAATVR